MTRRPAPRPQLPLFADPAPATPRPGPTLLGRLAGGLRRLLGPSAPAAPAARPQSGVFPGQLALDLLSDPATPGRTEMRDEAAYHPSPPVGQDAIRRSWLDVQVEYRQRLRRSWRLEHPRGRHPRLIAPALLQHAPAEVRHALEVWVHAVRHPHPGSRRRSREAANRIFAWLQRHGPGETARGSGRGRFYDLEKIFDDLNRRHFGGSLSAFVRWSPRPGGRSYQRELDGPGSGRHLITLSRAYDGEEVPRYAVEGVLYHEMLHIVHPPRAGKDGRRQVHHREFRQAERAFEHFVAWREWEARNIHRRVLALHKGARIARKKKAR